MLDVALIHGLSKICAGDPGVGTMVQNTMLLLLMLSIFQGILDFMQKNYVYQKLWIHFFPIRIRG